MIAKIGSLARFRQVSGISRRERSCIGWVSIGVLILLLSFEHTSLLEQFADGLQKLAPSSLGGGRAGNQHRIPARRHVRPMLPQRFSKASFGPIAVYRAPYRPSGCDTKSRDSQTVAIGNENSERVGI
ncbi:MAG: hypothetical protein PVF70_10680 [Anaerolineales bacterium]